MFRSDRSISPMVPTRPTSAFRSATRKLGREHPIGILPDRRIQLLDPVTKQPAALTITCDLPVGHDTVVRYAVRKVTEQRRSAGKRPDRCRGSEPRAIPYKCSPISRRNRQPKLSGNITFARVGNRVAQHLYSETRLP